MKGRISAVLSPHLFLAPPEPDQSAAETTLRVPLRHGFKDDTTPRYDKVAATLAWQRTMEFFKKNLRG